MENEYPVEPMDSTEYKKGGIKEIASIAFPMVVSNACETMMMFADRLFLSKLGEAEMSASMGGGVTAFLMISFFVGLIGYASPLAAQFFGRKNYSGCGKVAWQGIIFAFLGYPIVMLVGIPAGRLIFTQSNLDPQQFALQMPYFTILMYGALFPLLRTAFSSFFSGIGKTGIIMTAAVTAMTVNIGLNYCLIFGKFGFPQMGIEGAAVGTIIGSATGCTVLLFSFLSSYNRKKYFTWASRGWDRALIQKLWRFGGPSGLEFAMEMLAFNLLIMVFHGYNLATASAITIAFNWDMISFIPMVGVNIAVSSLVGRYMGANEPETAAMSVRSAFRIGIAYIGVILFFYVGFTQELVDIFLDTESSEYTRNLAIFMVQTICFYIFADTFYLILSGALRGAGDTFFVMVSASLWHWLFFITAYINARYLGLGAKANWGVVIVLIFGMCLTLAWRYRGGKWKTMQVLD